MPSIGASPTQSSCRVETMKYAGWIGRRDERAALTRSQVPGKGVLLLWTIVVLLCGVNLSRGKRSVNTAFFVLSTGKTRIRLLPLSRLPGGRWLGCGLDTLLDGKASKESESIFSLCLRYLSEVLRRCDCWIYNESWLFGAGSVQSLEGARSDAVLSTVATGVGDFDYRHPAGCGHHL